MPMQLLQDLEQENEILAYVDDSYTDAQARALEQKLEALPNVTSVTFISQGRGHGQTSRSEYAG